MGVCKIKSSKLLVCRYSTKGMVLLSLSLIFFWTIGAIFALNDDTKQDFYYSQHFEDGVLLSEFISFIPEDAGRYSIEEIVALPDSLFFTHKDIPGLIGETLTFWLKFKIVNDTEKRRQDYLASPFAYDSVKVYSKKFGLIDFDVLTGFGVHPNLKRVPLRGSLVDFDLRAGEELEFYIRGTLRETQSYTALANFFIFEDFFTTNSNVYFQNFTRVFLTTILFILAVFSLVIFFTFRERIFIIYAVLMTFLTLYFLDLYFLMDYLYFQPYIFDRFNSNGIIIAGVILFSYLFISSFLDLAKRKPLYNRIFLLVTLATFINGLMKPFYIIDVLGGHLLNILILIFTVLCFVPIVLLSLRGIKEAKVLFFSMSLMFAGTLFYLLSLMEITEHIEFAENGFLLGVIAFSGTLFYGLFDKINTVQKEKIQFRAEKEKTDELLFNILPYDVALELKEKGYCEARSFENVSILFTDFKDFTSTSTKLSAKELVDEINSCFVAFDLIVEKYKIEKIKTIGDSYMAAGGLDEEGVSRVKDIVLAGIEMQEFLTNRKKETRSSHLQSFEMRVGIHTGPVVAGIVGVKKFQYDLWGDTVNTASRVESYGAVGRVNVSNDTYPFIKDDPDFVFEKRGNIEVRGKGKLGTWFVRLREGV